MATVRTACTQAMLLALHFGARARRCGATACGGGERSRPCSRTPTATAQGPFGGAGDANNTLP